jgi:uncharacterized protein (TIGR03435 family)
MMRLLSSIALVAALCGAAWAQNPDNITGTWQGALKTPGGQLRLVIKISVENDKFKAVLYSIDQQAPPISANSVTRDGATIKMAITALNGTFEGKLSPDGNSISGTWSQGPPTPLDLVRATPDTAWTIPEPPPPPKIMAADAKPSFEVSTIKPSRPEERFSLLLNGSGMLNTTATSVTDLIKFAYDLHPRQITGGPSWMESEKFDVAGKPDEPGIPSVPQLKMMIQKLLTERFHLTFHKEKKEMAAYAITVTKTGSKITKADPSPVAVPGFGGGGPRGMNVRNATMAEFATILQANILDRPVVDQTGFGPTRYNFILKWTPDAAQLQGAGAPPNAPPPAPDPDAPPDIFTAFQQQLGLKLDSVRDPVDVIVVERLEKPSEN